MNDIILSHYILFFSTGTKQSLHVNWFLNIICDGLCSKVDWEVLKNMDLLNKFLAVLTFSNEKDRVISKNVHLYYYNCICN